MTSPTISPAGAARLQSLLDELTQTMPGCQLSISTPERNIFNSVGGKFDFMEQGSDPRMMSTDDVYWFASTTKAITSVCYLQLVDKGLLTLDTEMGQYSPELEEMTSKVFLKHSENGEGPIFEPAKQKVTLRMMLNQSSGFGQEFGDKVKYWKSDENVKGRGYVNSCKVENLVNTPVMEQPGTVFMYGNSAE